MLRFRLPTLPSPTALISALALLLLAHQFAADQPLAVAADEPPDAFDART